MTERYEIKHRSQTLNEPLPKERQAQLHHFTLEIDGKASIAGWVTEEESHFGVFWQRTSSSPLEFFLKAQALRDALGRAGEGTLPRKFHLGLEYKIKDAEEFRKIDNLQNIEEVRNVLEDADSLLFARFDTPYADFSQEKNPDGMFISAMATHINDQPDIFAQFILENCSDDPPIEKIRELLEMVQEVRTKTTEAA